MSTHQPASDRVLEAINEAVACGIASTKPDDGGLLSHAKSEVTHGETVSSLRAQERQITTTLPNTRHFEDSKTQNS